MDNAKLVVINNISSVLTYHNYKKQTRLTGCNISK